MMRAELYAWAEGALVGVFALSGRGIDFAYQPDVRTPVSLSLPLNGSWDADAPANFLEGLLPERAEARLRMRIALDAPSEHPFDLLRAVDSAGGLVFLREGEQPRPVGGEPLRPATEADIEAKIASSYVLSPLFDESAEHCRFSLAGFQTKFTLARIGGDWYWPSACTPSTHIVKPPVSNIPHVNAIEDATMTLASLAGLSVPLHAIVCARERSAYFIERFDRSATDDSGPARRLRTEDFAQALGIPVDAKYDIDIPQIVAVLRKADPTDELAYSWIEQMAFNAFSANADAHAKNYSLLLAEDGIQLCPLYDCLTTEYWPCYEKGLALPFNDCEVFYPCDLTPATWEKEAQRCGLDCDRVVDIARTVSARVLDAAPEAYKNLAAHDREKLLGIIEEANRGMGDARGVRPVPRATGATKEQRRPSARSRHL